MSLFKKLRDLFRTKRPILIDPLFGEIEYCARLGEWAVGQGRLEGRLVEVDEITIDADESGPMESHRKQFEKMLAAYDQWIGAVEEFLHDDYRKWCKILQDEWGWGDLTEVKGFPILETPRDALDHTFFQRITVTDSHVYIYICIGWEVEHNRGVFIKDGRYTGYEVS